MAEYALLQANEALIAAPGSRRCSTSA